MTEKTTNTVAETLKNTTKFKEFVVETDKTPFEQVLKNYPENDVKYIIDLTQKAETYHNIIGELQEGETPYIIWVVTNTKPELLRYIKFFNNTRNKKTGIFLFQASSKDNQIQFECILKPNKTAKNLNSGNSDQFYLDHWNKYVEICNKFDMNMQIKPIPKRSTFISIGNSKIKIMQTVSKKSQFVSSELYITDKNIYDLLFDQKDKIEKEIGELEWLRLDGKTASRIVKKFNIDIEKDPERAAQEHIRLAQSLKEIYKKYIAIYGKKSPKQENK